MSDPFAPPPPGAPGSGPTQPGFGPVAPHGMDPPDKPTNVFAGISLTLGFVAFLGCFPGIVAGVFGVIFGFVALRQIGAAPERFSGSSLAIVGIVLSIIGVVMWTFVVLFLRGMANAGL